MTHWSELSTKLTGRSPRNAEQMKLCALPACVTKGRGASPEKTAATRARIDQAAQAAFLASGFERTRMIDVARAAEVAKGTLYLYYPTKADMFEGMLVSCIGDAMSALQTIVPGPGDTVEQTLRTGIRGMAGQLVAAQRLGVFRMILVEGPKFPDILRSYKKVVVDPSKTAIRALAQLARDRGEISTDALDRVPGLLVAPGLYVTVWNDLFPQDPQDLVDTLDAFLDVLFQKSNVR